VCGIGNTTELQRCLSQAGFDCALSNDAVARGKIFKGGVDNRSGPMVYTLTFFFYGLLGLTFELARRHCCCFGKTDA